jgi:putative glutamine amidotransferase
MPKLIGITPRLLTESGVEKQFINTRYIKHLTQRGFNTIQINLDNPNNDAIFEMCDGFLITGGTDVDPIHFNEVNEGLSKNVDMRLDLMDKQITEYAIKSKKPLLGICRGLQTINVFSGGSLYQDLQDLNNTHNSIKENHEVMIKNHPLFGFEGLIKVNSYHHQAIKDVADSFDVIGRHIDGTIEMIVHKTLPIFAVQWHPEIDIELPFSKLIFDTFEKLVKKS